MRSNIDIDNPRSLKFRSIVDSIVEKISQEYDIKGSVVYDHIIMGAGTNLLVEYAKTLYDINVSIWQWRDADGDDIAYGLDFEETPELTKLLLRI